MLKNLFTALKGIGFGTVLACAPLGASMAEVYTDKPVAYLLCAELEGAMAIFEQVIDPNTVPEQVRIRENNCMNVGHVIDEDLLEQVDLTPITGVATDFENDEIQVFEVSAKGEEGSDYVFVVNPKAIEEVKQPGMGGV